MNFKEWSETRDGKFICRDFDEHGQLALLCAYNSGRASMLEEIAADKGIELEEQDNE